ncbi:hypothetical protein G3T14_22555 [Methylobacterium sp. BTF04]|nr:hypothetical protein [Methylobacterium sp. BTF04]
MHQLVQRIPADVAGKAVGRTLAIPIGDITTEITITLNLGTAAITSYWLADRQILVDVLRTQVLTPVVKPGGKLMVWQIFRYIREYRGLSTGCTTIHNPIASSSSM